MINLDYLKSIMESTADPVGISGVALLLTAFFLLNTHRITAKHLSYQVLNLTAAVLILYSLIFHWNTPSVMIELAWITISMIGITRTLRSRKRHQQRKGNVISIKAKRSASGR